MDWSIIPVVRNLLSGYSSMSDRPPDQMKGEQNQDRSTHGYQQAMQIYAAHSSDAEQRKNPSANDGAGDAEQDVTGPSGALSIDNFAGDKSR
jgi:hypothetical protein